MKKPDEKVPRRWREIMIDIETLATSEDAAVLQIGAVPFDDEGLGLPRFARTASLQSNLAVGRRIDAETLKWWTADPVRVPHFTSLCVSSIDLYDTLKDLWAFLEKVWNYEGVIWCRGPMDCRVLEHAYAQMGVDLPWHFGQVRDQRTALEVLGGKKSERGAHCHDALADAVAQAEDLLRARRELGYALPRLNWEAGWERYRTALSTSGQYGRMPGWNDLAVPVRNAWALGLQEAVVKGITANREWPRMAAEDSEPMVTKVEADHLTPEELNAAREGARVFFSLLAMRCQLAGHLPAFRSIAELAPELRAAWHLAMADFLNHLEMRALQKAGRSKRSDSAAAFLGLAEAIEKVQRSNPLELSAVPEIENPSRG